MKHKRLIFGVLTVALLLTEIAIALWVNDAFIRPYGGDILVTLLLCCLVRIVFPDKPRLLPLYIFLFSVVVEIGQYFDFVALLGLADSAFFSILLGRSFAFADIVCYAVGCAVFAALDHRMHKE